MFSAKGCSLQYSHQKNPFENDLFIQRVVVDGVSKLSQLSSDILMTDPLKLKSLFPCHLMFYYDC